MHRIVLTRAGSARRQALNLGTVPERAAVRHGSATVTLDHDLGVLPGASRDLTVADLGRYVVDLSARLAAAGVRRNEHVVIHKSANFDIWLLATAVARLGAVPVMLSPALDGETVAALLRRLDRPHLLTDQAKVEGPLADLPLADLTDLLLLATGSRPGAVSLASLVGAASVPAVVRQPDAPALMTHTSGTTGIPKLVVHSGRTLGGRFRPQRRLMALVSRGETVAVHVSYVHSRMFLAMAVVLRRGMPLLVLDDGEPGHVAEQFARVRPGFLETHPNSYMAWEELAEDPRRPLSNVKVFSTTFDAIHPGTMDRLLRASYRRTPLFFQIYGQSECGPLVGRGYTRRTAHRANGRCLGYPMPGVTKFRLVPRGDRKPSRKHPGYIDVYTPGRAVTYYGEDERFRQQVHGRWWRGGDVGYRTRFGCLHLLDREVDIIPSVHSTLEVEDHVLAQLAELTELVLVPGPAQEPLPVVCTRNDEPLDRDRWRAAVARYPQLADPVQLALHELPRTATMKVQRIELARRLWEQPTRRITPGLAEPAGERDG